MEDERIIDLYWQRSQEAISRTDEKYGRLCTKISLNILSNAQDAEECVSDTYMALWNSIPPQRPTCFQAFAAAIVRNLSLMKLREQYARKRGGGEFDLVSISLHTLSRRPKYLCVSLLVLCFHSGHCLEVQVFTKQSKNLTFPNQAEITAIFI